MNIETNFRKFLYSEFKTQGRLEILIFGFNQMVEAGQRGEVDRKKIEEERQPKKITG